MKNNIKKTTSHTETKPKTQLLFTLCLPYSLAIEKPICFSFLCFPLKYVESTRLGTQCNPIWNSSAQKDYFPR